MVEDPKTFGKIAATNALSDIYAMGARPLYALNIVYFPEKMDKKHLKEMLTGGAEKIEEANTVLAGGHSIYDHEPKYGLAVTATLSNRKIINNNTPKEKDVLLLTKALGVGIVQSAVRVGLADKETEKAVLFSMQRLNKDASEKMKQYNVHACTDITGFGFLGHLIEMVEKDYTAVVDTSLLPLLPNAYHFAEEYLATAGGQRNREFLAEKVSLADIAPAMQEILFDPQTSGSLLISVAADKVQDLLSEIQKDDPQAQMIGEIVKKEDAPITYYSFIRERRKFKMLKINALGKPCPIPVVETKKALRDRKEQNEPIEVSVDNQVSVNNITKMTDDLGIETQTKQLGDEHFTVTVMPKKGLNDLAKVQEDTVLMIGSKTLGKGDSALGDLLMKSYIYSLTELDDLPSTLIFFNEGAFFDQLRFTNSC